jgi:hypothetical protein
MEIVKDKIVAPRFAVERDGLSDSLLHPNIGTWVSFPYLKTELSNQGSQIYSKAPKLGLKYPCQLPQIFCQSEGRSGYIIPPPFLSLSTFAKCLFLLSLS